MEKKNDIETRWGEMIRMLTEKYTAYGSYLLIPTEAMGEQSKEVNVLLKRQAELIAEEIVGQGETEKTMDDLMEDIELVSIEKHGMNLVGCILVI